MPSGPNASLGTVARSAVKAASRAAAVAADALRPPSPGVTILIYHRVGGRTGTSVDLPTDAFDAQIAHLAERCRVRTLTEAADLLTDGARAPELADDRPDVVVTFDDGTADFVDEALPVLVRHGVPATYYLATDFLDRQRPFPDDGVPMTWAAAAEAVASGLVDIGSHTHTHALLDRVPRSVVVDELDRSIESIGSHLGLDVAHFAYPKAVLGTPEAEAEVRARFRTATIARTRSNPMGADLHRLTRSPIQRRDDDSVFRRKLAGGLGLEDDLRSAANRWRHRRAVT